MTFVEVIHQLSPSVFWKIVSPAENKEIHDISLLENGQTEFAPDILYFGYKEQLQERTFPPLCMLETSSAPIQLPKLLCCAFLKPGTLFRTFNAVHALLRSHQEHSLYKELLSQFDAEADLHAVLETAAQRLGNALILVDRDYRVIAHTARVPVLDRIWQENIEQGFCSYAFICAVRQLGIGNRAAGQHGVIDVTCSESPFQKYCIRIFIRGSYAGFLLMVTGLRSDSGQTVPSETLQQLAQAGRAVTEILSETRPQFLSGQSAYEHLLYDLLIGADASDLSSQIRLLRFAPSLYALCAEPSGSAGAIDGRHVFTQKLVELLPDTHVTFHEGCVAALVPAEAFEQRAAELTQICCRTGCRVGLSDTFDDIALFSVRYTQAKTALLLSRRLQRSESLCLYASFAVYDMLDHFENKSQLGSFCHDALTRLRQYDEENSASLFKSLRVYLESGGSIKNAAAQMYIHRNSMVYRLEKIAAIGGVDPNDPETMLRLMLSYRIFDLVG